MMTLYQAKKSDIPAASALAALLFEGSSQEELARELESLLDSGEGAVFLLEAEGAPAGFAQVQLRRDYVEGAGTSPVGYLEGIFVRPEHRGQGYARALLDACGQWARERGCTEFASDCELHNSGSLAFHLRTGFAEANRIICFIKRL